MNLVTNAIKFTFKGEVKVTAEKTSGDNLIRFAVSDTGQGMKSESKSQLFKMFGKIQMSETNENSHGVGLGLTICKELIEILNGENDNKIHVQSTLGEGTTISFEIPVETKQVDFSKGSSLKKGNSNLNYEIKETESNKNQIVLMPKNTIEGRLDTINDDVSVANIATERSIQDLRLQNYDSNYIGNKFVIGQVNEKAEILVVDDNSFNLMAIVHYLQKYPVNITKAFNGQECLDILVEKYSQGIRFHLIFMDIQMPILDGIEATIKIREMVANNQLYPLPVVALTANIE